MTNTETHQGGGGAEVIMGRTRGRPRKPEGGARLHIVIPDKLAARLEEIQRDTHASSITEVVKDALQLYAATLEEHKAGGRIYFERQGEDRRQLNLFI